MLIKNRFKSNDNCLITVFKCLGIDIEEFLKDFPQLSPYCGLSINNKYFEYFKGFLLYKKFLLCRWKKEDFYTHTNKQDILYTSTRKIYIAVVSIKNSSYLHFYLTRNGKLVHDPHKSFFPFDDQSVNKLDNNDFNIVEYWELIRIRKENVIKVSKKDFDFIKEVTKNE